MYKVLKYQPHVMTLDYWSSALVILSPAAVLYCVMHLKGMVEYLQSHENGFAVRGIAFCILLPIA